MSTNKTIAKWIEIDDLGWSASGMTKVWGVFNKRTGEDIGRIKWYGANGFRGYCFYPKMADYDWLLFDAACMRMIADFIDEENGKRRAKTKRSGTRISRGGGD